VFSDDAFVAISDGESSRDTRRRTVDKDFERLCDLREEFLLLAQRADNPVAAAGFAQAAGSFAVAAEMRSIALDGIATQRQH
jgi:hypothetical protein